MKTVKLYTIYNAPIGSQFIVKEHPELQVFKQFITSKEIKRLNIEQYFKDIKKNYLEYVKVLYGPVFGFDDPRNGFMYEHFSTGEILLVDEKDIPQTMEICDVITAELTGMVKLNVDPILKTVVTSYSDMVTLSTSATNITSYNELIRDEWILDRSFLIIE